MSERFLPDRKPVTVGARHRRSFPKGRRSTDAVPLQVVGIGSRGAAIKIFGERQKICCCRAPTDDDKTVQFVDERDRLPYHSYLLPFPKLNLS